MATGPLSGIRVADFSHARAGPQCTMMLGDMGAEIIKIERPEGEGSRKWGPTIGSERLDYLSLNRNKRGVVADFRSATDLSLVRRIVAESDVLVQNLRPGVMESFGLGADELLAAHPHLIYCTIGGYGEKGPLAEEPCYDQVIQGYSGIMSVTGTEESVPVRVGLPVADLVTGVFGALAVVSALYERAESGNGQHVSTSLLESMISLSSFHAMTHLVLGQTPERAGNHHPIIAPTGTFEAADGQVTIAVATEAMWQRLCQSLDLEWMIADERFRDNDRRVENRDALIENLNEQLRKRPRQHWVGVFQSVGVPCGPVNDVGEALDDPQVRANEMVLTVDHPTLGPIPTVGFPINLSRTPLAVRRHPPKLGEHTAEIAKEHPEPEEGDERR